jgi:ABC-type transport system involved in multi-copper enzyme maturation permease subunit
MRVFMALVRRELAGAFNALTGWVVMAATALLTGISIVDMVTKLSDRPTDSPVTELFYQSAYFWVILLVVSPVITMRTFAAEKSSGTYEALMTTPVGDWQVVLAKYTGSMLFFGLVWLPLLGVQTGTTKRGGTLASACMPAPLCSHWQWQPLCAGGPGGLRWPGRVPSPRQRPR